MTAPMPLSRAELFEDASAHEAVAVFVAQALARGEGVCLGLAGEGGTLSSEKGGGKAPVHILGRWRAPDFAPDAPGGTAAGLLMPLVFYIREIRLAASAISTLGQADRPVADLFARCLLHACLRGSVIDWGVTKWFRPDLSRAFAVRYLALLSEGLTEPAFAQARPSECMDLALVALHLGQPVFESPLLQIGARQLHEDAERAALHRSFRAARAEVLKVVAP